MCYFQYFCMKKTRRQKQMTLLINQVLFSFQMRKYSSFAEMNMIIMTITKAQLLLFDSRNMRYPSSKFHYSYLLKSLLLLWLLFFFINRFFLTCVFFLWLFNPYNYKGNPHLVPTACSFIKRETLTRGFPVNFTKFLRTSFL